MPELNYNSDGLKWARDTDYLGLSAGLVDDWLAMVDDIEALLEYVAALESQLAWQPIETAPKGGAVIMIGNLKNSFIDIVYWLPSKNDWVNWHSTERHSGPVPTHWMPPPSPPEVTR